ncbi:hypothetical protein TNCV_735371 [Trichonephila clavipes]|uniref:Uncharacterized protein n=1 Tax=Trichonephila clavipes TaxID=2585209 RepID=A0A8X6VPQ9_TRICX|nr:hypothetical protein TNCV_735371 [Trichonephila clavipes]
MVTLKEKHISYYKRPAGWRGWLVSGLLYPRLRARPRLKSVDFHDVENRQWPCRLIIRHEKHPLSVHLVWMLWAKLNPQVQISHRQSSSAFFWGRNWTSKLVSVIGIA